MRNDERRDRFKGLIKWLSYAERLAARVSGLTERPAPIWFQAVLVQWNFFWTDRLIHALKNRNKRYRLECSAGRGWAGGVRVGALLQAQME